MKSNFDKSLEEVLKHEGGYVDHPIDPGGATNKGITIATFKRYIKRNGTKSDLRALTVAQAGIVYKKQYWDKVKGDGLPSGIDYAVFDFAVNSGPSRAAKFLQAIVGVPQDGKIGPITLAATNEYYKKGPEELKDRVCDDRLAFLKRIKGKNGKKLWDTFGRGWSRRVDGVRRVAGRMCFVTAEIIPEPVEPEVDLQEADTVKAGTSSKSWLTLITAILSVLFGKRAK